MRTKTIVFIAWPASVLLVGWLGCLIGMHTGVEVGGAIHQNEHVRRFQLDVADVAKQTDPGTREMLLATANLAGQMSDTASYTEALREFVKTIQGLQNNSTQGTGFKALVP